MYRAVIRDGKLSFGPVILRQFEDFLQANDGRAVSIELQTAHRSQSQNAYYFIIALYLIAINALAIGMFALDKYAAEHGEWRIAEGTLLFTALFGGSPGAITAQHWLRHKNRKEPFRTMLYVTALCQIGALIYLYVNRATFFKFVNAIVSF